MSPLRLDHVTLSSGRMDETVAFYGEILRMRPGFRPPLEANGVKVGGVWLYADGGDYPILHIIDRKPEDGPTGAFNHFAFRGTGLLAFLDHLRAHAVDFKAAPEIGRAAWRARGGEYGLFSGVADSTIKK